jgi:hypothetical protein
MACDYENLQIESLACKLTLGEFEMFSPRDAPFVIGALPSPQCIAHTAIVSLTPALSLSLFFRTINWLG